MRSIQRILILLLTVCVFSCSKSEIGLENANKKFTSQEIYELDEIISKFDSILLIKYNYASLNQAYLIFSDSTFSSLNQRSLLVEFDLIYSLYEEIDQYQVVEKVWWKNPNDETRINYGSNRPYMDYLYEQGLKNSLICEYWENIHPAADIGANVIPYFSKNAGKLNFNNRNHRLIFAIHYITLYNR